MAFNTLSTCILKSTKGLLFQILFRDWANEKSQFCVPLKEVKKNSGIYSNNMELRKSFTYKSIIIFKLT